MVSLASGALMPVKVRFLMLADLVNQTEDGKLNIMGTFDFIMGAQEPVAHPRIFVVSTIEANVSAGFHHTAQLKIADEDGSDIFAGPIMPFEFGRPGAPGMPMRANFVLQLVGIVFPRFGDYSVTLWVNGVAAETATLYIKRAPAQ